ncbi:uncharacterized protein LOC133519492 [Cydia pomonella]|uniref:uncharacterized protein LOC133519492 n=1 Tax=Cydia pomonella TaxID=82600 RepID=UPI002ADDAD3A|nr:uncharacterized protein LOC133519492 [Cydia pomonella]
MSVGKIKAFEVSAGNWNTYVERVNMYFKANNIKEELQLPTLIAVMGEEAYELLSNLTSPKKPGDMSYEDVIKIMSEHIEPKPSFMAERYRLRQRRQGDKETVAQYLTDLKKLAKHCEFSTTLEENLRDQFVCGLKNDTIRQRLFAETKLTYTRAVQLALSLEAAEKDAAMVERPSVSEKGDAPERGETVHALTSWQPRGGNGVNKVICAVCGRYKELFSGGLGRFSGGKATLRVREGATPVFCRARPLPYALRDRVEAELDEMLRCGVIEPVDTSEWATPLVPVRKADGGLRICADYKVTLNPALLIDRKGAIWNWNERCEKSFKSIKKLLVSAEVLSHYDPNKQLTLTTDASSRGISGVLTQPGDRSDAGGARERLELYEELGCVMWGHRVVTPDGCRDRVLSVLHESHMGIVKTKAFARSYVWWPGIDEAVERTCRECSVFAAEAEAPARHAPCPWSWPARQWTRVPQPEPVEHTDDAIFGRADTPMAISTPQRSHQGRPSTASGASPGLSRAADARSGIPQASPK